MIDEPTSYEDLKALADELGRPLKTLFACDDAVDPWMAGLPARKIKAEWFAAHWRRLGVASGTHIRRFHYQLISQATPVIMPDGAPYENTEDCSLWLGLAAVAARHLDLIPGRDVIDQRNQEIIINFDDEESGAAIKPDGGLDCYVAPTLAIPTLKITAPKIPQGYIVELWIEKSTMNDIILPIAERYGVNVLVGTGETSITRCIELCDRANAAGRPVRILYISDFDPGGKSMPLAAARKIEFTLRKEMPDLDIQLRPIMLTLEQCQRYRLPRTPMKESEKRAARFEERFGGGATELDALEALHPGIMAQIIEREIERYYDGTLKDEIEEAKDEAQEELNIIRDDVHEDHAAAIQSLRDEHERVQAAINAFRVKALPIYSAIQQDLDAEAPAADSFDWPDSSGFAAAEDADPLFDSTRDYVEQIDRYKEHQDKPVERASFDRICAYCSKAFTSGKHSTYFCCRSCSNAAHYEERAHGKTFRREPPSMTNNAVNIRRHRAKRKAHETTAEAMS